MLSDNAALVGTTIIACVGILAVTIIHIGNPCGADTVAAGIVTGFTATTVAGLLAYRKASQTLTEVKRQNDVQGQMLRK